MEPSSERDDAASPADEPARRHAGFPGDHPGPDVSSGGPLDDASIDDLIARHLASLRAFIRLRAGAGVRALESESDLVQSVCRELLQKRAAFDFRGDAAFRSWLYTAALRKVIEKDRYHKAARRDRARRVGADGLEQSGVVQRYAELATPSADLAAREQMEQIERAFTHLAEEHREVLSMVTIAGLPIAEVAAQLGKTEGAVRQLLRRARVRLAVLLEMDT